MYRGGNIKNGRAFFNMTSAALLLSILLNQMVTSGVFNNGTTPLSSLIWIKFDLYLFTIVESERPLPIARADDKCLKFRGPVFC